MLRAWINLMIASMIFFPVREFSARPEDFSLKAEEAWCETKDHITLHGWFFQAQNETQPICLLLFHGNADNISIRLPKAQAWMKRGISVFLIDYRGYGKSEGKIEKGNDLLKDGRAAFQWLKNKKNYTSEQIILYGESIGAVPAIELAVHERFKAVILEAPFTSLKEMARRHYGLVPDFLIKDFMMDNETKISSLKSPLFILHGEEDEIVPFEMGKRLFEKAPEPKQLFEIKNAHHNDISIVGGRDFFEAPYQFVMKQ
jgi:alpha-beta hydrolase superfamily lysophospholipase